MKNYTEGIQMPRMGYWRYWITTCLSITLLSGFSQSIVQRMEPENWWADMQLRDVQIMLYGEGVGHLHPQSSSDRASISSVTKVPNPNYLFIDLRIEDDAQPGTILIDLFSDHHKKQTVHFDLLERQYTDEDIRGFDPSDAIYLITPDRFANGDEYNDVVEGMIEGNDRSLAGGRHGGDIAGIREHLDYIKNLGFTALWLNPVLENNMDDYSYHGYATTDFYKVDPRFGSNRDYQLMAEEARSQGLKLIMDMIVNHCGINHWWMDDLPSPDWVNEWPEYTETSHRKTVIQDPYATEEDKKVFTDGWFVRTMPDLNQRNPLLAKYLIQNSIWWIEYLGLAGIRMDTYPYPDMHFMTDWTEAVMSEYPLFNIVGEEWYEDPAIVSYWQEGKSNPNGYSSRLKSLMDFPLQAELVNALNEPESWGSGMIKLYEMLGKDFLYADPSTLVTFPDNHDMSRIYTQLHEDLEFFKIAMSFLLTTRGIPQIYYGTEVLMTNPGTEDHGVIRSDFPGGWEGDVVNAFAGKGLSPDQNEATRFLSTLLTWRKQATAVHNGALAHFEPKDGTYVYFRYDKEETVMVVLNKNTEPKALALDRFRRFVGAHQKAQDIITKEHYDLQDTVLQIPARSALVLELN